MNSENSKTSDPHRLLPNISDTITLKRSDKYAALSNLNIHGEIQKSHTKIINLKYQLRHRLKGLNDLMDHILYQIFEITLNISLKNMR